MNLPELQQDEALRYREFPVSGDKVYLAHAFYRDAGVRGARCGVSRQCCVARRSGGA